MNLDNLVAIITGGASGMGRACVDVLSKQGVKTVIWDRKEEKNNGYSISCDVSSAKEVQNALDETIRIAGSPRICINCAGIAPAQRMVGREGVMPLDSFKQVIDVNLIGTFNVMSVVAGAMTKLDPIGDGFEHGVIINTASIAAYEGQIGQTAYSASKGGIVSLTLPAARELAQFGIRVNTIAPGLIATPLLLNMQQDVQDSLAATVPFPKRFGDPKEFAFLVEHIIQNSMINGEVIRLDGALRMQSK